MKWPKGYWNYFFVDDYIVDQLETLLKNQTKFDTENLTINGRQTFNVIDDFELGYVEIPIFQYTEFLKGEAFESQHVHLIDYDPNGYQLPHDHSTTEDFSYIVYLNDSDQKTAFYRDGHYMYVTPERGKGIAFDSGLLHWSLPGTIGKKIAVGAAKFIDVH